jgi:hypothetical protein
MQLHVDDDAFVRAPTALVYRRLTNIGGWPAWWRGCRVRSLGDPDGTERWSLELATSPLFAVRVAATPHSYRHNAGFRLDLTGDLDGFAEFWLAPSSGGTVVHHVMLAEPAGRPLATMRRYRTAARRGLWGLKDDLHTEVRTAVGLVP